MRKLSELKINPAPWKVVPYGLSTEDKHPTIGDVVDATGESITIDLLTHSDACMIAAAPLMYEALRMYQEAFTEIRKSAWFLDANFHEIMKLNNVMTAAEAALAKAAGESEVSE